MQNITYINYISSNKKYTGEVLLIGSCSLISLFLFLRMAFSSFVAVNVGLFYLSLDRAVILAYYIIILLSAILRLSRPYSQIAKSRRTIMIVILMYFFWRIVISAIFGSFGSFAFSAWEYLITGNLTLIFLSLEFSRTLRLMKKLIILVSVLHIVFFFYEYVTQHKILAAFIAGDQATAFQITALETIQQNGKLRYSLNFSNPLVLAQYSVFVLSVSVALRKFKCLSSLEMYYLQVVYSLFGFSTGSRMFMVCFAINCGVLLITVGRKYFKTMVGIILLIIFAVLFSTVIINNMKQKSLEKRDQKLLYDSNRIVQMLIAIPLIKKSPFWGYGVGKATDLLGYKGANSEGMNTIDNYFLSILLDSGVVGLFLYLRILFLLVKQLFFSREGSKLLFYACALFMLTFATLSISELHPVFFALVGISFASGAKLET